MSSDNLNDFLSRVKAKVRGGLRIVGPDDGLAAFPETDYSDGGKAQWMEQYGTTDEAPQAEPERVIEPAPVDPKLQRILDEGGLQIRRGKV